MTEYRKVAKELKVHYLFGRWGFKLWSSLPDGRKIYRPRLIPLDGWIKGDEMLRHFQENGFEL